MTFPPEGAEVEGAGAGSLPPRWYRMDLRVRCFGYKPEYGDDGGEELCGLGHTVQSDCLANAVQSLTPVLDQKWTTLQGSATIADLPVDHTLPTERRREKAVRRQNLLDDYKQMAAIVLPIFVVLMLVLALVS